MSSITYDIVTIGDFRFPGGTSTAIAEELRAQVAAGYRTGIVPLKGPTLKYPHPFHPKIRACIDEGLVDLLDPDLPASARLVLAHHPALFTHLPRRSLRVHGDIRLLIVHHPPFDGRGEPFYDCATIDQNAREILGGDVHWAPIGPTVREQFTALDQPPRLLESDWFNILDADSWFAGRDGFCQSRPVIGRHSRPDPLKWPDDRVTTLAAYPDDPRFVVRVLGGGSFLRDLVGPYPPNWQVMPFNAMPPEHFVQTIDFFVYYHASRWVEAFGRAIIEAMASGAVTILPPSFEALFGDGAVYAEPDDVCGRVRALYADWRGFQAQSQRGRTVVQERFSHAAHSRRLDALIGPPSRIAHPVAPPRSHRRRAMFMTSNGVGMGHLTRMLAIAKRCPEPIEPVFVTLSQAMKVVHQQGFLAEYLPYHLYLGCDIDRWNDFLREELSEMLAFYDPAVVLFDGNVPYEGLLEVIGANPDPWFVWCRRGMWRPGHGTNVIDREGRFDAVLEPRDLAEAQDHGLTAHHRDRTRAVDPIRLLDAPELLPRDQARQQIGLSNDRPAALLQLGSGNNYDYSAMQQAALAKLAQHGVQVVRGEWLIADAPPDTPPSVQVLSTYPFSRYFNAFDLVISAVGYNSFHELLLAGVPTIFVPNEHPQQDDQLGRARFAERHGLAICVRTREIYRLGAAIDRLLDPEENRAIRTRCAQLDQSNGAVEAARFVEEMTFSRKIDRP